MTLKIPKFKILIITLLIGFAVAIPVFAQDEQPINPDKPSPEELLFTEAEYDLNQVLITYTDKADEISAELIDSDIPSDDPITSEVLETKNAETIVGLTKRDQLYAKMEQLQNDPNILNYQPSYVYRSEVWTTSGGKDTPNDFDLTPSAETGNHWYYEKSRVRELWNDQDCAGAGALCGGESAVTVAVIDTGLAFEDHTSAWNDIGATKFNYDPAPDLFGGGSINLYTNSSETENDQNDLDVNGFIDDYNGVDTANWVKCEVHDQCTTLAQRAETGHPNDDGGHGTYVTRLIASLVDNGSGSVSPAHNVTIMPIKANFQKQNSFGTLELYYAVRYAADHGADIINMSLSGPSPDDILKNAIDYAVANGVIVVASSGNSGTAVQYPAAYDNVVAVGAVNSDGGRSSYSSYGSQIDLVAYVGDSSSGESTYQSTYQCGLESATNSCYSSTNTNRYTLFETKGGRGTSFAAPQVAAAAALIIGNNPGISRVEVEFGLISSTTDITSYGVGWDTNTGSGVIDYSAANEFSVSDITETQYLPAYRNTPPAYKAWVIVGNPSSSETLQIGVIHSDKVTRSVAVGPGDRFSFNFNGYTGGPVKIIGDGKFYATIKSEVDEAPDETTAFIDGSLDTKYYFPAYRWEDPKYRAWIIVGNPNDSPVEVEVIHSGTNGGTQTETIPANDRMDFKFIGASGGPVSVRATDGSSPIYATIKSEVNGRPDETEGIAAGTLDSQYYLTAYRWQLPEYKAWIIVGNPNDSPVEVEVAHSGVNGGTQTETVPANGRYTFKFEGAREGPVSIRATDDLSPIYVTVKSEVNGGPDETPGIAENVLDTQFYYPAYRSNGEKYEAWIIVGNPNLSSVDVTVEHFGPGGGTEVQSISPGDRYTFKFVGASGGPVSVTSSGGSVYTTIKSEVNDWPDETSGVSETSIGL